MATSISMHVLLSLSRIIISGLLLGTVLSVRTYYYYYAEEEEEEEDGHMVGRNM